MGSTAIVTKDIAQSAGQKYARRWYRVFFSPLWLCLLVALLLRIWLIVRTQGVIDGDEALVGIQAERILHGVFPIYFYGIPYFGSLEAYLVALLFAIFGPSVPAMRAEPVILSLALVWLVWRFAGALAEQAQLSPSLRRTFMTIAALLAAVPPLYDGVIEMRTFGGWIETFVLMLLLLLATLRLTQRWQQGASARELALRWAGIGFVVGLGMWVYPLITTAIFAATFWILGARSAAEVRRLRGIVPEKPCVLTVKGLLLVVAAIPTAVIGFTPAILWGATNQWQNIRFIVQLGGNGGLTSQRFQTIQQVWQLYRTCVAPRIIGGGLPLESALLVKLHKPLVYAGTLGILVTVALVLLSLFWQHPSLVRIRQLALLPLLFAAFSAVVFCLSSASTSGLMACSADFAGRYATPLLLTLPFIFAAICIAIIQFVDKFIPRRGRTLSGHPLRTLSGGQVITHPVWETGNNEGIIAPTADLSECWNGTDAHEGLQGGAPRGRPLSSGDSPYLNGIAVDRPLQGLSGPGAIVQIAVFVLVLLYVGIQGFTYGLTDPARTFQSPYCMNGPANNDPLIAYMQQEHIRYAWATNFLAYPIVFKTDRQIIAADPLPVMHPKIAINRIPEYTTMVMHADRPSFIVFVHHGDPHLPLLSALTGEGVTYHYALFPSEPGIDILIVTPLNRTVSPFSSKAFDIFNCNI